MILSPSFLMYVDTLYDKVKKIQEEKLMDVSLKRTYPSGVVEQSSVVYATMLAMQMCRSVDLYGNVWRSRG